MIVGRRRQEPEAGHGSGISIGGSNIAPVQNVVGQNISNVHQSAAIEGSAVVDRATVRELLEGLRADVERHEAELPNVSLIRGVVDSIDTALVAPDVRETGALTGVAHALPALVAGTAVQQAGEALAQAIAGWAG
ncbi:hypothetical protein [Streptomyces sp. R44]|uniref:Uncharacterized protein n=1 Tax=Streptomyces sp. R44 TaxID=3238633 RepID=A0AB39T5R2_9ACTN